MLDESPSVVGVVARTASLGMRVMQHPDISKSGSVKMYKKGWILLSI